MPYKFLEVRRDEPVCDCADGCYPDVLRNHLIKHGSSRIVIILLFTAGIVVADPFTLVWAMMVNPDHRKLNLVNKLLIDICYVKDEDCVRAVFCYSSGKFFVEVWNAFYYYSVSFLYHSE